MPPDNSSRRTTSSLTFQLLMPVRRIFRAVVATVVPEASNLEEPEWEELEQLAGDALISRSVSERRQLRWFLRAIQWLPVVRWGRCFTALDSARRQRFLSYLQGHRILRIRAGFWGLRTLALLGYYGRPQASRAIGYTPDSRGWSARR